MSLFFVQRHINNLTKQIKQLDVTIEKLEVLSKKLTANFTAKLNNVCYVQVKLKHTSQLMVNLGGDYFLDCTKDESLGIAKRRREYMQTNLDKLNKIKQGLEKKQGIQRGKGYDKIPIQKNDDGEDVFQIMQYPEEQEEGEKQQKKIQQSQIKQQDLIQQKPLKTNAQFIANNSVIKNESVETKQATIQKPKRISKFKQQRNQMRTLDS